MVEELVAAPPTFERDADKRLFLALRRRLWEYEPLRATHPLLEVQVNRGTVRLSGRVRTLAMKEIVGYLCLREDGVATIRNELVSDTEVARQVADAFSQDDELGPLCLRVDVRAGTATLTGDLPAAELEARATDAARAVPSVAEVVSELAVRPPERPPTAPPPRAAEPVETSEAAKAGPARSKTAERRA